MLYLYITESKKSFLEKYKHDNLQNEYVIWNSDTRNNLIANVREHFKPQIDDLTEFSKQSFDFIKVPGNLPLNSNRFTKIIQYECLNKEIKIGQYYAKMWVINASKVQMTNDEIDDFFQIVEQIVKKNSVKEVLSSNTTE